jgi:uncharacterized protein
MAGSSLLTLIDDIATILDDVAVLTKVAAKKTAGVLGDDLALNAQQVTGVRADRELPVVWAVAKGSAVNKAILVPIALLISAFAPWAITPLLMLGGAFLCFEGAEKLAHKFLHSEAAEKQAHAELVTAVADENVDLVAFERDKIKAAIRTDFILSAEIIVISLGSIAEAKVSFGMTVAALIGISAVMTIGVYGLVAGIVKLDDLGMRLDKRSGAAKSIGRAILWVAPLLMKFLSVVGTAAMFIVGGGIVAHGIGPVHHLIESITASIASVPAVGGVLAFLVPSLCNFAVGLLVGAVLVVLFNIVQKLRGKQAH